MGPGFLGTPASIMLDVVVCSLFLVVPALLWSIYLARIRRNFSLHKKVQLILGVVLLIVVILFEIDLRRQGGFWELAKDSAYFETAFLRNLLNIHLVFSISTVFIWAATYATALWAFPSPPRPGSFSPKHKVMAWVAVVDMVATVVTGLMVYYFGFMR
jgi:putative membrane protein